jgi:hypothetical protein
VHEFFDRMARAWRGWDGILELRALPPRADYSSPVFRLRATADGAGHITLITELGLPCLGAGQEQRPPKRLGGLADPASPGAWQLRLVIVLELWQLDGLVAQASQLTRNNPRLPY